MTNASRATGLLAGKVAVVAGAGPGLGADLACVAADAGAKVVLAARSADRINALVHTIESRGGEAVAVPTDLTDDGAVAKLRDQTIDSFGRADVLFHNAFAVPAMKPLARTDYSSIDDGVRLSVVGGLRLVSAFTDDLEQHGGAIVAINSMVVRHSEPRYGSYRIAKAALLAAMQTLATELGERGIRVNSVVPGYIWGDQLKEYFGHIADKYEISQEAVYERTAQRSDLKRLPRGEEVARAAVFLASDWASAITGQTLDVNCGEYHV